MGISLNRCCERIPSKLYLDLCLSRMNDPTQLPEQMVGMFSANHSYDETLHVFVMHLYVSLFLAF